MEILNNLGTAIVNFISVKSLLVLFASSALGMIVGALPGLTATLGIVLLTGLTFSMSPGDAMTILMGVYVGAIYGGSITAIMINVPGTGSAAATCLDGYPLACKGEGASAIRVTRAASIVGTLLGAIALATITPLITKLALQFTSAEYFMLALFGVLICGSVSASDLSIKGWIAGLFGVFIALVGIDMIQARERFTFGIPSLKSGINVIPAMIGFFAIPQILKTLKHGRGSSIKERNPDAAGKVNTLDMLRKHISLILRTSAIGVGIGALPGVGENIAAWLAYDHGKKTSKNPELFGTGCYEGVIAPETANNAAIGGALIPMLSLAVPGSPPTAVLMGALLLHGIRPGPMLVQEFPMFTYEICVLLFFASIMLWVVGVTLAKPINKIIDIPHGILMPIVAVLCIIGAYSLNLSRFDLVMMFVFGVIGYIFETMGYPSAAIVLGMILGGLLDENFRRALIVNDGNIGVFVTRPISLIFFLGVVYTFVGPIISRKIANSFRNIAKNTED
jgi:putative tricarboxylic transport membrane protein